MLATLLFALVLQPLTGNEAPGIVAALTQETVEIREDFDGTELVIFGATRGLTLTDEIVVILRGPDRDLRVMRKARNFGIWMNTEPVEFNGVPSYYAIASSRPMDEFADPEGFHREGIGLEYLLTEGEDTQVDASAPTPASLPAMTLEYSRAVAEAARRDALYAEAPNGVVILDGGLFRARIALPPRTPVGDYIAEFYLFRNGRAVASRTSPLRVEKAGFERVMFQFAHQSPIIYGLFCVALAMLFGWIADAIFSRR
jgi:uncharacterized protein (TIGR02186 family)